tara:strand:- start:342 stop:884 length:543 start_codon:yes stop_codon:yes gene_type:complete
MNDLSRHAERMAIRNMTSMDASRVLEIYQQGIDTGHATFQAAAPTWEAWDSSHLRSCRLVATYDGGIVGWAAVSPVSRRPVYEGVAELSLYIASARRGRGLGARLLGALINLSEADGIWTLQAGIFPENQASLALHKRCGFREVGRRRQVGLMSFGPLAGHWRDVVLLERRSTVIGQANR